MHIQFPCQQYMLRPFITGAIDPVGRWLISLDSLIFLGYIWPFPDPPGGLEVNKRNGGYPADFEFTERPLSSYRNIKNTGKKRGCQHMYFASYWDRNWPFEAHIIRDTFLKLFKILHWRTQILLRRNSSCSLSPKNILWLSKLCKLEFWTFW